MLVTMKAVPGFKEIYVSELHDDAQADWFRFANENLYMANEQIRQLQLLDSQYDVRKNDPEVDGCSDSSLSKRAAYISSYRAAVGFCWNALEAAFSLAAKNHKINMRVTSLDQLVELIGTDNNEVQRMLAYADKWLQDCVSLKLFFNSPASRVNFNKGSDDLGNDLIVSVAADTEQSPIVLISQWNFYQMDFELLNRIVSGIKSYLVEIQVVSDEW